MQKVDDRDNVRHTVDQRVGVDDNRCAARSAVRHTACGDGGIVAGQPLTLGQYGHMSD